MCLLYVKKKLGSGLDRDWKSKSEIRIKGMGMWVNVNVNDMKFKRWGRYDLPLREWVSYAKITNPYTNT